MDNMKMERRNRDLPKPDFDPKAMLKKDYTRYYLSYTDDSPDKSRTSLARRMKRFILDDSIFPARVLNIGSGAQALEKQLLMQGNLRESQKTDAVKFTSIDIAKINKHKLLGRKIQNLAHVQGDAALLPFPDKSFGMVVSNHAIDFCPQEQAFKEAFRVLNDGGKAIFYLHHPSMLEKTAGKEESVMLFWEYLKKSSVLFKDEDSIKKFLEGIGFMVKEISIQADSRDEWWEIVAEKKNEKSN